MGGRGKNKKKLKKKKQTMRSAKSQIKPCTDRFGEIRSMATIQLIRRPSYRICIKSTSLKNNITQKNFYY
eukprot:scaffold2729_cov188-Ochromonas_danica.AAC.3